MGIYLSYPSALEYLRAMASRPGFRPLALDACALEDAAATVGAVREAGLIGEGAPVVLSEPISLLLPGDLGRSRSRLVSHRTWSRPLPARSLFCAGELPRVIASTPGFCLLQAASTLAFEDLMQLALELCGAYSSGPRSVEERCGLTPLTTARSLGAYLASAGDGRAAQRARRVAALAIDGVGSPMEGVTYLLLCLPQRLGGYGLPAPRSNMRVSMPFELRRYCDMAYVRPDLCWPGAKVVVEYDSDEHHRGGRKSALDSARANLLAELGYEVHPVNAAFLKDGRAVEQLARHVARRLGTRCSPASSQEIERRELLRTRLLDRSRDWKHGRRRVGESDGARRVGAGRRRPSPSL